MATFQTEIARNVNFQLGSHEFGPFLLDDDVKSINITFSRDQWTNPEARLDLSIEVSYGGGPFQFLAGLTGSGGLPFPAPRPNRISTTAPFPEGSTQRRVRGVYAVSGARFRSTVTATGAV